MTDRNVMLDDFLQRSGWGGAHRAALAGDASNRRYDRLVRSDGQAAVLMDAPPRLDEDILPFLRVARHLSRLGLSAPQILGDDVENGFLLLEDMGDDLVARVADANPELERDLFAAATDLLLALRGAPRPELTLFTPEVMTGLTDVVFSHYAEPIAGPVTDSLRQQFTDRFSEILTCTKNTDPVLIHRDYHAENLVWLPDRGGVARIGLLDFQDAVCGHPAYDLVSMLQDVRRDVPLDLEEAMIARYLRASGEAEDAFRTAYAVLGVQRNLRILGVFGRLSREREKPHYLAYIPRTWANLQRGLDHPALRPVAGLLRGALPAPTNDTLQRLKSK